MQPSGALPSFSSSAGFADAQRDMRVAYIDGAPGLLVSATVWAVAGLVCLLRMPLDAVWALYAGGVLIYPLSLLLTRALGRTGSHAPGNPLGALALATTVWMILMLAVAYGIALWRIALFFPAVLCVIGGRYLCFATVYGMRLYLVCGAMLALAGYGLATLHAAPAAAAFCGAIIEGAFAAIILAGKRRERGIA